MKSFKRLVFSATQASSQAVQTVQQNEDREPRRLVSETDVQYHLNCIFSGEYSKRSASVKIVIFAVFKFSQAILLVRSKSVSQNSTATVWREGAEEKQQ